MRHRIRERSRSTVLLGFLVLAVLAAACGGGDDDTAEEGSPDAAATEDVATDEETEAPAADEAGDDAPAQDPPTEDAAAEDLGTVTVALSVPESVTFLPADLGPSQGKFDECGITVENITGESSTVGRSLAAGEADIALQFGTRGVGEIMQGIPAKVATSCQVV